MRTRLLLAAVCILSLPVWFSPSTGELPVNLATTVVFAGHVLGSDRYCACGPDDCVCDPNEPVKTDANRLVPGKSVHSSPVKTGELNLGSEVLLLALLLAVWLRARA